MIDFHMLPQKNNSIKICRLIRSHRLLSHKFITGGFLFEISNFDIPTYENLNPRSISNSDTRVCKNEPYFTNIVRI